MEPSLSGSSNITQQQGRMQQDADGAASPGGNTQDAAGLQRLTAALTAVLSSGMASDFVEGLKPVLHNGKLAISTYIKLQDDPEPVFIGMFASLPAAVAAQKQSAELVGHLPAGVARKLVAQQLAHTDPTAGGGQKVQPCHGGPHAPPERWQSNTTSESTAVGAGSSSQAGDATPKTGTSDRQQQQQQQQQHDSLLGSAAAHSSMRQQQRAQSPAVQQAGSPAGSQLQRQQQGQEDSKAQVTAALQSALAAAAAMGAQGGQGPTPGAIAAPVAAALPRQPGAALTDDVIRMLLNKGLHALTVAQQQQHHHGQQGSNWQQQQQQQDGDSSLQPQLQQETEASLLDIFNTPVSTPGSGMGLANALQQLPSPQQQLTQQQRQQALMQQLGTGSSPMDSRMLLSSLSALRDSQQGPSTLGASPGLQQQYGQRGANPGAGGLPGRSLPGLLPLAHGQGGAAAAAAAGGGAGDVLSGDLGLALDGALNDAMLRGVGPWGPSSAAGMALPYSQAPAAYSAGFAAGAAHMGLQGFPQHQHHQHQQQQQAVAGDVSQGLGGGYGADYGLGEYAAAYGMQQQQQPMGLQGMQYAGGAAYAGELGQEDLNQAAVAAATAAAAAAAAAAAMGDDEEGVGDKRKRTQNDPRANCVKSVQYRVSRFPAELHDLCIEHWERARCARVVCNEIQGVMSVQNGRCVVTFNQNSQEVVKGVADYLRYAGEIRIKKWRRHVRMVDFPRPGNRSGELMTAEEFLCIVGYQSEAGGGKRARTDYE